MTHHHNRCTAESTRYALAFVIQVSIGIGDIRYQDRGLVLVSMMDIRKVRVRMRDGQMDVRMGVGLVTGIRKVMLVLMMFVVPMPV